NDPIDVVGTDPGDRKYFATAIQLQAKDNTKGMVKYLSIGVTDIEAGGQFFAISGADHNADKIDEAQEPVASAKMGVHNAWFELAIPRQMDAGELTGTFNLVFADRLPNLRYTLFDADGNVLAQAKVEGLQEAEVTTSVVQLQENVNSLLENIQLFPNPADTRSALSYDLAKAQPLRIELRHVDGRLIQILQDEQMPKGQHRLDLQTSELAPGNYLIRMVGAEVLETRQLVIVR
ncbi:MAG: T9SS type A sorting domain-containing protein, partial [Bacteroidota bacterium]